MTSGSGRPAAGDGEAVRAYSLSIRSLRDLVDQVAAELPDADAMEWRGPAAEAFAEIRWALLAALRSAGEDLTHVIGVLEVLATELEESARVNALWERMVGTAETEFRSVVAAAADTADGLWMVGAAQGELAAVRSKALRQIEQALAAVEVADRTAQRAVSAAMWSEPVSIAGPVPLPGVSALMRDPRLAEWIESLPDVYRNHLASTRPELVGAHPSFSLAERYRANLVQMEGFATGDLADRIARLEQARMFLLATVGVAGSFPHLDDLRRYQEDLLRRVEQGRTFLVFDGNSDGLVVEVWGDLESAAHIAVLVPGIGNTQFGYESGVGDDARRLWGDDRDVAVIAWLGYDTPGSGPLGEWPITAAAIEIDHAVEGAVELRRFVDWLADTRPLAHITVIGHSYGSVVAAIAASEGLAADELVLAGSPGVPLPDGGAADLRPGGVVWASLAPGDPIDELAAIPVLLSSVPDDSDGNPFTLVHGINPMHSDFAAVELAVGGATGHSAYFAAAGLSALRSVVKSSNETGRERSRRAG